MFGTKNSTAFSTDWIDIITSLWLNLGFKSNSLNVGVL